MLLHGEGPCDAAHTFKTLLTYSAPRSRRFNFAFTNIPSPAVRNRRGFSSELRNKNPLRRIDGMPAYAGEWR